MKLCQKYLKFKKKVLELFQHFFHKYFICNIILIMINKFEDFVLINEGFKSNKLRDIIRQHGKPEYDYDKFVLHDLEDDEIIGVMNHIEWSEYHDENRGECYGVMLKDGMYLVIGNIEHLKYALTFPSFAKEFKKRRDLRHPGNEFNDIPANRRSQDELDTNIKHFRDKKSELIHKRTVEELKKHSDEIVEIISSEYDNVLDNLISDYSENFSDNSYHEFNFELLGKEFSVCINYYYEWGDTYKRSGAEFSSIAVSVESITFTIDGGTDEYSIDEIADESVLKDYFSDYKSDAIEVGIYDQYEYYGVKPSDFY